MNSPALQHSEWLERYQRAIQFGRDSIRAGQIADVLTFGQVQPETLRASRLTMIFRDFEQD